MKNSHLINITENLNLLLFCSWDFIEYGLVMQDSYVSELFALNNSLLIHYNALRKLNKDDLTGIATVLGKCPELKKGNP